jgi:hypothetical protein
MELTNEELKVINAIELRNERRLKKREINQAGGLCGKPLYRKRRGTTAIDDVDYLLFLIKQEISDDSDSIEALSTRPDYNATVNEKTYS